MPDTAFDQRPMLDPRKFRDPQVTASGEARATVTLNRLRTLWFNTGSLCNITCENCYIESSPRNDRLAYLSMGDVCAFLEEIEALSPRVEVIGFTGGEPFLNREFPEMLAAALARGYRVLVLTNAMKPMQRRTAQLLELRQRWPMMLTLRVSIDHYQAARHEAVRGRGTWAPALAGLRWLVGHGFRTQVAGRLLWGESERELRAGYAQLFSAEGLAIDAADRVSLVLFPEMHGQKDVPEITTRCWEILGKHPDQMMCATARMVLKRKGAAGPAVVPCTLLPYDPQFELGTTLRAAQARVSLNHPFCSQFCVLGGASCSAT